MFITNDDRKVLTSGQVTATVLLHKNWTYYTTLCMYVIGILRVLQFTIIKMVLASTQAIIFVKKTKELTFQT